MTPLRTHTLTRARVEIIPLIDVVFFLLATFVLFTLSLNRISSIPLTLPESGVDAAPVVPPVVVSISAGGALFWDGTPIAESELHGRLALLRESAPDPRVLVAGDRHASYRTAVAVLDAVRAAGIASVSVETRVRPSVH